MSQIPDHSYAECQRLLAEIQQLKSVRAERDRMFVETRALTDELERQRSEVRRLEQERAAIGTTLHQVLSSRAWKLAELARSPLRALRSVSRRAQPLKQEIRQPETPTTEPAVQVYTPAPPQPPKRLALDNAYQRWIEESEPSDAELDAQREFATSLNGPILSIVVPIHHTDHPMLQACIQSILAQTYQRWELCAAITPGGDPRNLVWLLDLSKADNRVRIVELGQNLGISANSNSAIDLATGEFVVLLDHDDTLAPFALFEVASRLVTQPDADILYSDHDYLDLDTELRRDPLFKPDWSPAILFSANYITHLTVLRKSLLVETGRFNSLTDGAQDWDLFLRLSERTSRIAHIPKILYHWRMHAGSTAHNDSAKSYVANAQLVAIGQHLQRGGVDAAPEIMPNGLLHVRFRQPPTGKISIIIPTKDRLDLLSRCISSLLSITRYDDFEVLILDNGSQESGTKEYFRTLVADSRIRIIWHPGPFNYSGINNRGASEAKGDFLLFLNNDVEITQPDWLTELVAWAALPKIGIVGAKLLSGNGTIQHAGVVLGMSGFAGHPFSGAAPLTFAMGGSTGWYRDFLAVTGACMMIRRGLFNELGGFDESFILCGSDVEICLRANDRGYQVFFNPFAELIHYEQQTRGTEVPRADFLESLKHYRRWLILGDPYWNPNLSLWNSYPSFRYLTEESSLKFAERHISELEAPAPKPPRTNAEELHLVDLFDCGEADFERLHQYAAGSEKLGNRPPSRVLWFVPVFDYPFYGGAHTLLRFADSWQRLHGVESLFAICDPADHATMLRIIRQVYPQLKEQNLFVLNYAVSGARDLPAVDVSICTLWKTAYYALHHGSVSRRFYLIQDYEPAFYRAGSASALAESTYRMSLYGIANTIGLKRVYESEYGGKAVHFNQPIDDSVFFPGEPRPQSTDRRWQVVCYGRPDNPRNAFEIVIKALKTLKHRLGDRVRIVSAGQPWEPAEFGLLGIVENLGVLTYQDSARLYRESDVGVVMMLTRHPSYIPLEMMASGCVTVTNINTWTLWLLKDGENCLLAHATPASLAYTVERALIDRELHDRIRTTSLEFVRSIHADWPSQATKVYEYMCDPDAAVDRSPGQESLAREDRHVPIEPNEETVQVDVYQVPVRMVRLTGCPPEVFESYGQSQLGIIQKYLKIEPTDSVLEIGSGVGRLAIPLTRIIGNAGSYLGIDIIPDSIAWCSNNITPRLPNFRFHFENVSSQIHNPSGTKDPAATTIPLPDRSVNKIFLSSVFTHMFPAGVHNYLSEFKRVLKPGGIVLSTMFLLNPRSRTVAQAGGAPWTFAYEYDHLGICWSDSQEYPEGAVAYDQDRYLEMLEAHDMQLVHPLVYGTWCGFGEPSADGQDYVIFGPK